jgi:hypothetical protein
VASTSWAFSAAKCRSMMSTCQLLFGGGEHIRLS